MNDKKIETGDPKIARIKQHGGNQTAIMNDEFKPFSSLFGIVRQMEIDFLITNINRDKLFENPINEMRLGRMKNWEIVNYLEQKQFGNVGRILSDIIIFKINTL